MDFMKDQLTTGRAFRVFNLIDEFSRKALASDLDTSGSSSTVRMIGGGTDAILAPRNRQ